MRVQFDPAVLAEPARFGRDVNAIIDCCDRGQHSWIIDDLDAVLDSAWILGAARWDNSKELAEKTFRTAIDEPPERDRARMIIIAAATPSGAQAARGSISCSAGDARRILDRPLYLVVENATSDWCFFRALVTTFDRHRIEVAVERHWLVPDQAGGSGELVKRARALIEQGADPRRVVVLTDSDRLTRGPLPDAVNKRVEMLNALGVTVIVLHKREVENYLPGSLLDGHHTHNAYVSWRSLSREQQDYYDMKHGLPADRATGSANVEAAQRGLFSGTNPWHMDRLVGGFGTKIGERFADVRLDRDEFAMVCATCPGEMESLLDMVEEWL